MYCAAHSDIPLGRHQPGSYVDDVGHIARVDIYGACFLCQGESALIGPIWGTLPMKELDETQMILRDLCAIDRFTQDSPWRTALIGLIHVEAVVGCGVFACRL